MDKLAKTEVTKWFLCVLKFLGLSLALIFLKKCLGTTLKYPYTQGTRSLYIFFVIIFEKYWRRVNKLHSEILIYITTVAECQGVITWDTCCQHDACHCGVRGCRVWDTELVRTSWSATHRICRRNDITAWWLEKYLQKPEATRRDPRSGLTRTTASHIGEPHPWRKCASFPIER